MIVAQVYKGFLDVNKTTQEKVVILVINMIVTIQYLFLNADALHAAPEHIVKQTLASNSV